MEQTAKLSAAMAKAFAAIEGARKDADNPHFKSKFASLGSVIDAIKPALIENGLWFSQANHSAEDGVCVETVIHHSSGEFISCGRLYVPANKKDAQGFGSALTYARRYGLMTAFGVPAEDDDGNAAAASAPKSKVPGIHSIKDRLRPLLTEGAAATELDAFNALVRTNKDDLETIKKYEHEWWTGDGEDFEGFKSFIKRRREELTPPPESNEFQFLASLVQECTSGNELRAFLNKHGDAVAMLDGEEGRRFEAMYDAKAEALKLVDTASA